MNAETPDECLPYACRCVPLPWQELTNFALAEAAEAEPGLHACGEGEGGGEEASMCKQPVKGPKPEAGYPIFRQPC